MMMLRLTSTSAMARCMRIIPQSLWQWSSSEAARMGVSTIAGLPGYFQSWCMCSRCH